MATITKLLVFIVFFVVDIISKKSTIISGGRYLYVHFIGKQAKFGRD